MKKNLKILSLILALVVTLGALMVGCGNTVNEQKDNAESNSVASTNNTKTAGPDISTPVNLKMVILGDKPVDGDLVYAELSKLAKKDINAEVEIQNIPWGDYQSTYPLLFASGEDLDLVFSADWADYVKHAGKGAFLEITQDLLKKACPITYEKTPEIAWEQTKVNGKIFMIPYNALTYNAFAWVIRGDLKEKYNIPDIKNMDDLENYMVTVAKSEKELMAYNTNNGIDYVSFYAPDSALYAIGTFDSLLSYDRWSKDNMKAELVIDEPWFKDYCDRAVKLKEAGVWSKNAYAQKETAAQLFEAGKSATASWTLDQIGGIVSRVNSAHPEWKATIVYPSVKRLAPAKYTQNGVALSASTKNPERALMFLELLKSNRDYYDLSWYGIKGKHYEPVGDDKYKALPDAGKYPATSNCPWGWWSSLERFDVNKPQVAIDLNKEFASKYIEYPYDVKFSFNPEKVKSELAAMSNVANKYMKALGLGIIKYDDTVQKIKEEYKKAGVDKVLAEMQAQIDEYKKNNP